jgi:hypothetical protein
MCHGLKSLGMADSRAPAQLLQADMLQKVLTTCTCLTQLALTSARIDDQGAGVLLTQGTSIMDLTLCKTYPTTSKADWA